MPSKSFFIELKVNFNSETQQTKDAMLRQLAARTASVLLANAMLLADRSNPKVTVIENDALNGPKDIDIRKFTVDDGTCPSCGHAFV